MVKAVVVTPPNKIHEKISESVDFRLTDTDSVSISRGETHVDNKLKDRSQSHNIGIRKGGPRPLIIYMSKVTGRDAKSFS